MSAVRAEISEIDPVDEILEASRGDARAAIADILAQCNHLHDQLELVSAAMSTGLTRGWQPNADRPRLEGEEP